MKRLVCLLFSAVLVLAIPGAALAGEELDKKREKWVGEYQELQVRHVSLGAELEQARKDYSRGRSTRYLRGEGKAGLLKEIQRLEEEYATVSTELEEFPDKARKEGAFPGWFRDLEAPKPAEAQPAAALEAGGEEEPSRAQSRADKRKAERAKRRRR